KEVVLFYTLDEGAGRHQANILVLRPKENTYVPIWKDDYEGSWGFIDPSGVRDITKSGKPFIIAYRSIGASCPGILRTFQYREGAIRPVPAEWDSHTCHSELQIKDLNGDGVMEIVFKPLRYGVNPDIYRWEGRRYVKSNTR